MTVQASPYKATYTYNGVGSATAFPFPFLIFQAVDLVVQKIDTAGNLTTLVLGPDYTVTGVLYPTGGTVTLTVALTSGQTVVIFRDPAVAQATSLQQGGAYDASAVMNALDYLCMEIQAVKDRALRSPRAPVTETPTEAAFTWPSAAQRANQAMYFDAGGNPTSVGSTTSLPSTGVTQVIDTIALLKALAAPASAVTYLVRGYYAVGDGGGGIFRWNSAVATTDNGGTIIQPNAGGVGRWNRIYDGAVSVRWFGAKEDGATDDAAALTAANSFSPAFVPAGTVKTSQAPTALSGRRWGFGQVKDNANNLRAPWLSNVTAAPSSFGTDSSVETAFNGDLSKVQMAVEHRIGGAASAGQPATGYTYTPEIFPHYTYLYNASGWNQQTAGNDGRTGIAAYRVKAYQAGQGDLVAFNASLFVTGQRAGATHWLANPAGSICNGDMTAGQAGVYLNPFEVVLHDASFDVSAIGFVKNLDRNNATGLLSTVWTGDRYQSIGAQAVDNIIAATGKFQVGLDFSMSGLDFGTNKAAISLKADDRIYFNNSALASGNLAADWRTTSFNGWYLKYDAGLTGMNLVVGGSSGMQVYLDSAGGRVLATTAFDVPTGKEYRVNNTRILTTRQAGFGLITGTANTAAFDTSTATLTQVAQYLKGLVDRLHGSTSGAHGLIGP